MHTFKLITTVRRGSASTLASAWTVYPSLETARAGGVALLRNERVVRIMILRNETPPVFVEWLER